MFETGFASRTRISRDQIAHIVVNIGGDPQLFCSGGKAIVAQPTTTAPLCRRCLAALREHDDARDVIDELGFPWTGALG